MRERGGEIGRVGRMREVGFEGGDRRWGRKEGRGTRVRNKARIRGGRCGVKEVLGVGRQEWREEGRGKKERMRRIKG